MTWVQYFSVLLVLPVLTLGGGLAHAQEWEFVSHDTANGIDVYTRAFALAFDFGKGTDTVYLFEESPAGGTDSAGRPCVYDWLLTESGSPLLQNGFVVFHGVGTIQFEATCNHALDYTKSAEDSFAWMIQASDQNLSQLQFADGLAFNPQSKQWTPISDPTFINFSANRIQ